ncbi:MAG TPA: hypothetical protein VGP28_01160 [Methylocella sp.]|jgi:hypothetical protein|nr:hypothetical protein [Methylocella sp.]
MGEEKTQFTIDLGEIELTDEEVSNLGNELVKLAIESVRKKSGSAAILKEPYVRVLHVKAIHTKAIHA